MNARLLLLLTLLAAAPLAAADAPGKAEKLAGEDDKAIPTAVPTAQGDERGPIKVSRTPQAASAFDLPAFVVTGSGERKALARRDDMGTHLDTSGGLKTSPGEAGAGKDQLEAQAVRAGAEQTTYTSKPFVGRVRINGGYAPTYGLDAMLAQELGAAWWSLQADASGDEGGPLRGPMTEKALHDWGHAAGQAGWRFAEGRALSVFGYGDFRLANPTSFATYPWLRHLRAGGGAQWSGPVAGVGSRLRLEGGQAFADDTWWVLWENKAKLNLDLEKRLNGRTGSTLVEAGLELESLSRERDFGDRQTLLLSRGTFMCTFDVLSGAKLGIGLAVDGVSGAQEAINIGPRLRIEKRLTPNLSMQARLDSGIKVSRLEGETFDRAQRLPDINLKPARQRVDAALSVRWQALPSLSFSAEGFVQEVEDQFLPSAAGAAPIYVDSAVRGFEVQGVRMGQRWQQGAWWQSLEAKLQRSSLPDQGGDWATFLPWGSGEAAVGGHWGILSAELRARLTGDQHAALDGSLPMPANVDVSAKIDATFNETWTLYLEGRNLAGQQVEVLALYPSPSPYVGAGVELRF